jgi:hypothetical protein
MPSPVAHARRRRGRPLAAWPAASTWLVPGTRDRGVTLSRPREPADLLVSYTTGRFSYE